MCGLTSLRPTTTQASLPLLLNLRFFARRDYFSPAWGRRSVFVVCLAPGRPPKTMVCPTEQQSRNQTSAARPQYRCLRRSRAVLQRQKLSFKPNCTCLGVLALVTLPTVAVSTLVLGPPKYAVFERLKASALNWSLALSVMANC